MGRFYGGLGYFDDGGGVDSTDDEIDTVLNSGIYNPQSDGTGVDASRVENGVYYDVNNNEVGSVDANGNYTVAAETPNIDWGSVAKTLGIKDPSVLGTLAWLQKTGAGIQGLEKMFNGTDASNQQKLLEQDQAYKTGMLGVNQGKGIADLGDTDRFNQIMSRTTRPTFSWDKSTQMVLDQPGLARQSAILQDAASKLGGNAQNFAYKGPSDNGLGIFAQSMAGKDYKTAGRQALDAGFTPEQVAGYAYDNWGNKPEYNFTKNDAYKYLTDQENSPFFNAAPPPAQVTQPPVPEQTSGAVPHLSPLQKAAGGGIGHQQASGSKPQFFRGGTKGQSDKVPAMLSDGEFVFDADSVAALGDGNTEAGASALEQMRQNIRAHKRAAPKNKIPPKAKAPEAYLPKKGVK